MPHCRSLAISFSLALLTTACTEHQGSTPEKSAFVANDTNYEVTVALGDTQSLTALYSYPNANNGQTLEQTIEHYLNQRVVRDLISQPAVDVIEKDGQYSALISGDSESVDAYQLQIATFLENGELAITAVDKLKTEGKWNDREWRFFLPLGLSIVNQRSVQLLHFPPDYSLTDQDYLNSKTSQRWEQLLILNNVPSSETTLYESILDIAPIAAPASAGSTLSDTYTAFEPYVLNMLPLLLGTDEGATQTLPIVAYGSPVRNWVSEHYKLQDFGVNTSAEISITDASSANILGANHPSFIWYAKDKSRKFAMSVMKQDLISACWQASMGNNPSQPSTSVVNSCTSTWEAKPMTVCINMEIQAYSKTKEEAKETCENDVPSESLASH